MGDGIMLQICHEDKEYVYRTIQSGHIDTADLSFPNLIGTIVLTMKHHGLLAPLTEKLEDKRRYNRHIHKIQQWGQRTQQAEAHNQNPLHGTVQGAVKGHSLLQGK